VLWSTISVHSWTVGLYSSACLCINAETFWWLIEVSVKQMFKKQSWPSTFFVTVAIWGESEMGQMHLVAPVYMSVRAVAAAAAVRLQSAAPTDLGLFRGIFIPTIWSIACICNVRSITAYRLMTRFQLSRRCAHVQRKLNQKQRVETVFNQKKSP